jgi:hypothetical protein
MQSDIKLKEFQKKIIDFIDYNDSGEDALKEE